jgi:cystathionine gamma-synthase
MSSDKTADPEFDLAGMHPETLAIHVDSLKHHLPPSQKADPYTHDYDIAPPIGVTTTFENQPGGGHIYARMSNPTRDRCEDVLAAIDSGNGTLGPASTKALLYSSGLAAAHAVFHALASDGKLRVAIDGGYHATHMLLEEMKSAMGSGLEVMPLPNLSNGEGPDQTGLRSADLIWLETPRNPACDIYDIEAYVRAAKAVGARVCVDSTFAPPPVQRPLGLGADITMHSTTKGLAGHSDAMGGALLVADQDLFLKLKRQRTVIGSTPGSLEVWLLLRSLRSLHVRVERACANASGVARYLHESIEDTNHPLHGLVHCVCHPSLPSDPGHEIARRQMGEGLFGTALAVLLSSETAAKALPANLRLFKNATSLGGVESLVEWRRKYDDKVDARLLRFSIGLEHEADLCADLTRAIQLVSSVVTIAE